MRDRPVHHVLDNLEELLRRFGFGVVVGAAFRIDVGDFLVVPAF